MAEVGRNGKGFSRTVLRELSVQNLALIEDLHIELEGGYCAWTGETGAGKSLLLTALGLVLGGKASVELIRSGKAEARASAVFEVTDLPLRLEIEAILGGELDDDQDSLIITRRITAQGRGSAQVNGLPVTIATLQALGEHLVDIHGQNEGRALTDPDRQRDLLDSFGSLGVSLSSYKAARDGHQALRRNRESLIESAHQRQRERALLEFERDELVAADPKPGEYQELTAEAQRLAGAEQIRNAAAEGYALLYEAEPSAQGFLKRVARAIEPLARTVPELAETAATLTRLAEETREAAYSLRDIGEGWDDDPSRLEEVEERLALYRKLAARFRCEPDELAVRRTEVEAKIELLDRHDADLLSLDAPLAEAWKAMKLTAQSLTAARRKTAKEFAKAIQGRLKPLGLEGARLTVEVESRELGDDPTTEAPGPAGADRIEMLFMPNPGEDPKPLRKIASGGELSRVTLAAKAVLAAADRVLTLVFDEIDTGVGGRLGSALGKTLAELARYQQVICVTHLPQMASYADRQWVIRKRTERGRTRTTIIPLSEDERVAELAAMLRGASAAEGTRQEAQAMLEEARSGR